MRKFVRVCQNNSPQLANSGFEFEKARQLLIDVHNKAPRVFTLPKSDTKAAAANTKVSTYPATSPRLRPLKG
jgi:hypothetical protein